LILINVGLGLDFLNKSKLTQKFQRISNGTGQNEFGIFNQTINLGNMLEPAPGMLLIAEPFLKDPNFMRTVVLLCEHQDEGSFGFVLNRSHEYTLEELVPELEGMDQPVYYGGPVQKDTLHFLHQCPEFIEGGFEVANGIYWGGDFEQALRGLRANLFDASKIRFFVGYSGWTGGQLEVECKEKSWLITPARENLVFPQEPEQVWKDSLRKMGGEYEMMINFPVDPSLN
jgi:putative transcriptional regulator